MSARNGDKARFQKNRKRRLRQRQRTRALMAGALKRTAGDASTPLDRSGTATLQDATSRASLAMQDEGGPIRGGD